MPSTPTTKGLTHIRHRAYELTPYYNSQIGIERHNVQPFFRLFRAVRWRKLRHLHSPHRRGLENDPALDAGRARERPDE